MKPLRVEIAFDVGHSSIGWSVLSISDAAPLALLGCGSVIFEKDSALANTRRLHRSQRRHVRATRQRIARMEKLLVHLGIFTTTELAARHRAGGGSATPWLLAASVLASDGAKTLTWPELWDVLRWYAHNRGYEEITGETRDDTEISDEEKQDTEKVENAKTALAQFGKNSMAETICAWFGQDPLGPRTTTTESYKAKNCAFERRLVDAEVTRLLASHLGKLPGMTEALIAALILDARAIAVPTIRLPLRYQGSLLFGRLATRYHNRIIGRCPISGEKIPNKNSPEFLRYRWAMQLANLRIAESDTAQLRPLSSTERATIHATMAKEGALTPTELKKLVAALPSCARHNLEQFFLHPDAKEGLVFDPVRKLTAGNASLAAVWPHLPERLQKRAVGRWRRGKTTTLAALRVEAEKLGHNCAAFDDTVEKLCAPPKKSGKKTPTPTRAELLAAPLDARRELAKLSGRAPYARQLLARAFDEVMAGSDPKAKGGSLEETPEVVRRRETIPLPQQTNNHLVRHRLQILGRLLNELIADPAYIDGDAARVSQITLEVNRDLREMSGFTAEDIAKELGQRLAGHKKVAERLEAVLPAGTPINAGLIRKARIADDLGWCCPYTGVEFEPKDLVEKRVDKDHIIPRSQRATDSLEALAVTFSSINRWKGQRTAWQFVSDEGGKPVPDAPNLCIMPLARYKQFVERLDTKGHNDDCQRKRRRKEWLLLPAYEEKERTFTPGQLTQTSQLARLAAQVVRTPFEKLAEPPRIVPLPGSVTGTVRKSWDVLGCLAQAAPTILETVRMPDGTERTEVKTKTEIRDITHLHHALDACVLALAAHFIPNRGDVWRLLSERRLNPAQQAELAALGLFDFDERGQFRLRDLAPELKAQIRARLMERRVVQHVPADMSGLRVEENTRGVLRRENGRVFLRQRKRNAEGHVTSNLTNELEGKVIGLPRADGTGGKLAALNGVRVIDANFGVAILDDAALPPAERFVVIPHERVWKRLRELRARNGGKRPLVLRNGLHVEVPRGRYLGYWMIRGVQLNQRDGMLVDLSYPDLIVYRVPGRAESRQNVSLSTLMRDGLRIVRTNLAASKS
jgi:CRISPR-associated endonuclease Csn1